MKVPITQVYFQQPKSDAVFEDIEPICQRITIAVIIGALIFLATHILIWVLR